MTIALSANTPRVSYTVNAGATQTAFTVNFEFFDDADLNFYVDGTKKTLTTHYTVAGGDGAVGTINTTSGNTVTGITGNSTIVITRSIAFARTTDFPSSGAFQIGTLNTELDRFVAIASDISDETSRSMQLKDQDTAVSMELPLLAVRKGTVLGFNASTGAVEAGPTIANVNALSAITANINTVGGIASNVTTVAGISANVTTVAGVASNVTSVAGSIANVNALAASAVIADMALLGTTDVVADMALLGNSDVIADMALLAVSDVIADINTLATSDIVTDINLLATSDIVSDLNTLATSDIISDLNTLATSAIVADINLLGTTDVVADLAQLATSDFVSDLNTLATSTNVTNIATVASNVAGVNSFNDRYRIASSNPSSSNDEGDLVFNTTTNKLLAYNGSAWQDTSPSAASQTNINIVAGEITSTEDLGSITASIDTSSGNNIDTVANVIANVNTVAGANSNITALNGSGVISNIASVAGIASNVTTVAGNVAGVTSFAEKYRVASSAPSSSLNEGDLYYDTNSNALNYYNGSAWVAVVAGAMTSLIVDTSPQLGGALDVNGNSIVSASNGHITIDPNGSGLIKLVGSVDTTNLTMDFGSIA
jgi:hypothetical protein